MRLLKHSFMALGLLAAASAMAYAHDISLNQKLAANTNATQAIPSHDGEIIAFIIALDSQEMAAADIAVTKKVNDQVMQFAKAMQEQHGKNLMEAESLSKEIGVTPDNNEKVEDFKKDGKHELEQLSGLNDKPFEVAYIDAMVTGHTKALELVGRSIEKAKNPRLKTFLEKTRTVVEHHLEMAKKIQADLKK